MKILPIIKTGFVSFKNSELERYQTLERQDKIRHILEGANNLERSLSVDTVSFALNQSNEKTIEDISSDSYLKFLWEKLKEITSETNENAKQEVPPAQSTVGNKRHRDFSEKISKIDAILQYCLDNNIRYSLKQIAQETGLNQSTVRTYTAITPKLNAKWEEVKSIVNSQSPQKNHTPRLQTETNMAKIDAILQHAIDNHYKLNIGTVAKRADMSYQQVYNYLRRPELKDKWMTAQMKQKKQNPPQAKPKATVQYTHEENRYTGDENENQEFKYVPPLKSKSPSQRVIDFLLKAKQENRQITYSEVYKATGVPKKDVEKIIADYVKKQGS